MFLLKANKLAANVKFCHAYPFKTLMMTAAAKLSLSAYYPQLHKLNTISTHNDFTGKKTGKLSLALLFHSLEIAWNILLKAVTRKNHASVAL